MATRASVHLLKDSGIGSRRRQILAVGTSLFAEHGYHGTSIRDIAEACDLQPASLYSHFENKEELLEGVLVPYLEALVPALSAVADGEGNGRLRLARLFDAAVRTGYEHRSEFLILSHDWKHIRRTPGLGDVVRQTRRCEAIWKQVLKDGVADGTLRADVRSAQALRILFGAVTGMVDDRYDDLGGAHVRDRSQATRILLDGLSVDD